MNYLYSGDDDKFYTFSESLKMLGAGKRSGAMYWAPKVKFEECEMISPLLAGEGESVLSFPPDSRVTCPMKETPEFWFQMPKAGAKMHMDAHCHNTISLGLNGDKVWELTPLDTPINKPLYDIASSVLGKLDGWHQSYYDG